MNHARKLSSHARPAEIALRLSLTKAVTRLFTEWELSTAEQLTLLGLRETSRNLLLHYHRLEKTIPQSQDTTERIGLLLSIYKNIYDLYPENEILRKTWVKRHNAKLEGNRPLDIMLEKGLFGLADVMRFLDLQKVL